MSLHKKSSNTFIKPCITYQELKLLLVIFFGLFAMSASAAPVNPNECGGLGQTPCNTSSAEYLGKYFNADPGGDSFIDIGGLAYWRCPSTHPDRTLDSVTGDTACVKHVPHPGGNAFVEVLNQEYWECPAGFNRTVPGLFPINGPNACEKHNTYNGFLDVGRGEYWTCDGWRRTVFPVTASNACETGFWPWELQHKPARYLGKALDRTKATFISPVRVTSAAQYIKPVIKPQPANSFIDPRLDDLSAGLEYWRCPQGFWRNFNPVTHEAACSANIGENCDAGYVASGTPWKGYTCQVTNQCGGKGERPCLLTERIPSCNAGLAEDFVDNVCIDDELAQCLTLSRAAWVVNESAGEINNVLEDIAEPIGLMVNAIVNAIPEDVRNDIDNGAAVFESQVLEPFSAELNTLIEQSLTQVDGGDAFIELQGKQVILADKAPNILSFFADTDICSASSDDLVQRLESLIGSIDLPEDKVLIVGVSLGLNVGSKGFGAGPSIDFFVAIDSTGKVALGAAVGASGSFNSEIISGSAYIGIKNSDDVGGPSPVGGDGEWGASIGAGITLPTGPLNVAVGLNPPWEWGENGLQLGDISYVQGIGFGGAPAQGGRSSSRFATQFKGAPLSVSTGLNYEWYLGGLYDPQPSFSLAHELNAVEYIASQSSTAFSGAASRAIDGGVNGVYSQGSVSRTETEINPWWQVDLGQVKSIEEIEIVNRGDCCTERLSFAKVYVSAVPFTSNDPLELEANANVDTYGLGEMTNVAAKRIPINGKARYIRVQHTGEGIISLTEVIIKTVQQSSVALNAGPLRAVDGSPSGFWSDATVTRTDNELYSWWQYDLGVNQYVSSLDILNRTDCCKGRLSNARVFMSSEPFPPLDPHALSELPNVTYFDLGDMSEVSQKAVPVSRSIRFIRVQHLTAGIISLAEVKVHN